MIVLAIDLFRARKTLVVGTCAALMVVAVGYLALYPSIESQLQVFADDLPDAYRALLGDADFTTATGYVRSQVYSLVAPLIIAGASISAGSSLARSERDQTLAFLSLAPISRVSLVGAWWTLIGTVALCGALTTVAGVLIGAPLAGAELGFDRVLLATLPLLLFAVLIGTCTLLIATMTGAPAAATGGGWLILLISFVAHSISELVDGLDWLAVVSPWSWHGAGRALSGAADIRAIVLLVATTVVVGALATVRFGRRNLHF